MSYRDKIIYSVTGFATQEAAEKELAERDVWFKQTFDSDQYIITSGVVQTPYGFRAYHEAEKSIG